MASHVEDQCQRSAKMYSQAMSHLRRGSENGAGGDFGKANSDYLIGLTCLMDAIKIEPSVEKRDNMKHIMETFLKRAELFKKLKIVELAWEGRGRAEYSGRKQDLCSCNCRIQTGKHGRGTGSQGGGEVL